MSNDETILDSGNGLPQEATLDAGARIGEYAVNRLLGRGAMGEVYEAEHARLGRRYALKVLPASLASDQEFRARFEREARTLAALEHPNIVNVAYAGEDKGRFYLVMELLEPFFTEAKSFPLPEDDAQRVLAGILSALDYAHGKGIVHRDLKPANLLRAADGSAKVADFGVALVVGNDFVQAKLEETIAKSRVGEAATIAGTPQPGQTDLAGTLYYMAPEVVEGRQADARSDLYAVGFMGYEMLTGRKPIGMFRPPSHYQPQLAPGWDGLIGSLLEADPEDRPQSAALALEQLNHPNFAQPVPEAPQVLANAVTGAGQTVPPIAPVGSTTPLLNPADESVSTPQKKRSALPLVLVGLVLLAGLATGAYFALPLIQGADDTPTDTAQNEAPANDAAAMEGATTEPDTGGGEGSSGEVLPTDADAPEVATVETPETALAPPEGSGTETPGTAEAPEGAADDLAGVADTETDDGAIAEGAQTADNGLPLVPGPSTQIGPMPETIEIVQSNPDTRMVLLNYGSQNGAQPRDVLTLYDNEGASQADLELIEVRQDRSVAQVGEDQRVPPEGAVYQFNPEGPTPTGAASVGLAGVAARTPAASAPETSTPARVPEIAEGTGEIAEAPDVEPSREETVATPEDTVTTPERTITTPEETLSTPSEIAPTETGRVLIGSNTFYQVEIGGAQTELILATSRAEKASGMSGITSLAQNRGLLYLFEDPGRWTFSAANTDVNLDIGFFDERGRLLERRRMPARVPNPISPSTSNVRYVLTIDSGWFEREGISNGARIDFASLSRALRAKGVDPAPYLPTERAAGAERANAFYPVSLGGREIRVRLAVTEEEQRSGLIGVDSLPTDGGMLYVFSELRRWTFSAAGTDLAIDIGFFDSTGTLLEIRGMRPRDATPIAPASDRVRFVLEMNSGWFSRNRVFRGARLDLREVQQALQTRGFDPSDFRLGN
ncbi:MAG: DUF192 domain-containing protein [Opitutales bacterium]